MNAQEIQKVIDKGTPLKIKASFWDRLFFGMKWYLFYPHETYFGYCTGTLKLKGFAWIRGYTVWNERIIGEASESEIAQYVKDTR